MRFHTLLGWTCERADIWLTGGVRFWTNGRFCKGGAGDEVGPTQELQMTIRNQVLTTAVLLCGVAARPDSRYNSCSGAGNPRIDDPSSSTSIKSDTP